MNRVNAAPQQEDKPAWVYKLMHHPAGLYIISIAGSRVVLFSCNLKSSCWGLVLDRDPLSPLEVTLDVSTLFCTLFCPLHKVEALQGGFRAAVDVQVYQLTVEFVSVADQSVRWRVQGAREIEFSETHALRFDREAAVEEDAEAADDTNDSDSGIEVVSDLETDVEKEIDDDSLGETEDHAPGLAGQLDHEIADEAEAQGEASIERAAPGSYTVDTNGYFTITNSPTYPDCKVIMRGKWIPLLGRDLRSKTLTIREFDESEQEPFRTLVDVSAG